MLSHRWAFGHRHVCCRDRIGRCPSRCGPGSCDHRCSDRLRTNNSSLGREHWAWHEDFSTDCKPRDKQPVSVSRACDDPSADFGCGLAKDGGLILAATVLAPVSSKQRPWLGQSGPTRLVMSCAYRSQRCSFRAFDGRDGTVDCLANRRWGRGDTSDSGRVFRSTICAARPFEQAGLRRRSTLPLSAPVLRTSAEVAFSAVFFALHRRARRPA